MKRIYNFIILKGKQQHYYICDQLMSEKKGENKKWDGGRSMDLNDMSQLYALVVGVLNAMFRDPLEKS